MKRKLLQFSERYQTALQTHLKQGRAAGLELARGLGGQALAAGLQTLDLAKLHEHILLAALPAGAPAGKRAGLIKKAGVFFAAAITPIERTHRTARETTRQLNKFIQALSRRTVELAASNLELSQEIVQRKSVEAALKKSESHYSKLLSESNRMQEQLRQLSRQVLSAQEEERKKISRDLHDVIAQTLTGINIMLANLKKEAAVNTKGLDRSITLTQRMVEKSVGLVHQFALDLRPAVLDDLGLVPALHSFIKQFTIESGVRCGLTAFTEVEQMNTTGRTVLYRVAQEALNNVAKHAKASRVEVAIQKQSGWICMKIKDDGKSFDVKRALLARGNKRLGLLGMRERLEMVGGSFEMESSPGKGTMITARIPNTNGAPAHAATRHSIL